MGVVVLLHHLPSSFFRPVLHDTKTKSLLLTMSDLVMKGGSKVLLSNDKKLLDKYLPTSMEGGMDWDNVRVQHSSSWETCPQASSAGLGES